MAELKYCVSALQQESESCYWKRGKLDALSLTESCAREKSIFTQLIPLQAVRKRSFCRAESNGGLATTSNASTAARLRVALVGRGDVHREACHKYMASQDRASYRPAERPELSSGSRAAWSCTW